MIYLNSAVHAGQIRAEVERSVSKVVLHVLMSDRSSGSSVHTSPTLAVREEMITYKQYRIVLHIVQALLSLYTFHTKSTTGNIYFNVLPYIGPEQTLFSSAKTFLHPIVTVMDFLISHIIWSVKTINS